MTTDVVSSSVSRVPNTTTTNTAHHNKLTGRQKLVMLGDMCVGKSALVQVFHSDGATYPKNYAMTIDAELVVKSVSLPENVTVEQYIIDVAGHDIFQEIAPKYCHDVAGFIVVFDLTNLESFQHAEMWLEMVKKHCIHKHQYPGALVGNKIDLENRRVVSFEKASQLALAHGIKYFETSAQLNKDVDAVFQHVAQLYWEDHKE